MKIAILSDIHGNIFALEKVLIEAKNIGVTKLYVLGDMIGYYHYPAKVIELLNQWDAEYVKGNHEEFMLQVMNNELDIQQINKKYGRGIEIAINECNESQIEFIQELNSTKVLKTSKLKIMLCHGSPHSIDQYVYPDSDIEIFNEIENEFSSFDFIFSGHTHHPMIKKLRNGLSLINPGSVGQSRQVGGRADWAILETEEKTIQLKQTFYNTAEVKKKAKEIDPNVTYLTTILERAQP